MSIHFLVRKRAWCLCTINECSCLTFCDVDTVTSNAAKFDGHRSWASKEYYRNEMVRKIEALGVNASWSRRTLTYFNPGEYAAMGSEILSAGMWTLAITIPPAQPKTKRRRLMNEQ